MHVPEQKRKRKKYCSHINSDDLCNLCLMRKGKNSKQLNFQDGWKKFLCIPKKRMLFVIGGPWGFSEEVYARADLRYPLSKMTFPHQLVRLLFLEQLYRVFTIIKGEPYHHE